MALNENPSEPTLRLSPRVLSLSTSQDKTIINRRFKDDVSKTVNVKSRSVSPSSQLGEGTSKVNVDGLKSNKHSTRRRSHQRRQYPHQLSQGWITASENNHLVYNKTDSSRCYVYSEMKSKGPSRAASNSAKVTCLPAAASTH